MATLQKFYTAIEAADALKVTDARVRQLCIQYEAIGQKHGNAWILTDADLERIRNLAEFRNKPS